MDESKKLADDFEFIRARMDEISFEKEQVWGSAGSNVTSKDLSLGVVFFPEYDDTKTFTQEQKRKLATTFGCKRVSCYYSTSHKCYHKQRCCLED